MAKRQNKSRSQSSANKGAHRVFPPNASTLISNPSSQLLDFAQIEAEYGAPKESTSYSWACTNRHGFRDLVIKVGSRSMVRRADFERWLEERRLGSTV
jgi:hypothetical protein